MDYTTIPRALFYKEKKDFSVFTRNRSANSLEYQYFKKLKQFPFLRYSDKAHDYVLEILNNACYISTLILLEEQPSLYFRKYLNIPASSYENSNADDFIISSSLALVYNWLNADWYRKEYQGRHDDVDPLDEIIDAIYAHFDTVTPYRDTKWIREIFLTLDLGKELISYNLIEKGDISCRAIDEAIDDVFVTADEIGEGINYICSLAKQGGNTEYECFILTKSLSKLERGVENAREGHSTFLMELAIDDVKDRLQQLGCLPVEEPGKPVALKPVEKIENDTGEKDQEIERLRKECEEWKRKCEEASEKEPEEAFNGRTGAHCFTSTQMGLLLLAVAQKTENPAPAKTTIGEVVESISGYKATTVNQNMKGTFREADKEAVAKAIESRYPKLAAKVRKL